MIGGTGRRFVDEADPRIGWRHRCVRVDAAHVTHRSRYLADSVGYFRGGFGHLSHTVQRLSRPPVDGAAGRVAAADRHVGIRGDARQESAGVRRIVREVGVHLHDDFRAQDVQRMRDPPHVGGSQPALPAFQQAHAAVARGELPHQPSGLSSSTTRKVTLAARYRSVRLRSNNVMLSASS